MRQARGRAQPGRRLPQRGTALQRGAALVLALICLAALGAGVGVLVPLAVTERVLSTAAREAAECRYAAEAAVVRAMTELRLRPSWDDALSGAEPSAVADTTRRPTVGGSRIIDLEATGSALPDWEPGAWGADEPAWQLFAWGPAPAFADGVTAPVYVAVWAADDERDGDGDPQRDTNGTVHLRADAFGAVRGRRAVAISISRRQPAPAPLRILDWRRP